MRLAALPVAGVSLMAMRIVDHLKDFRCERLGQFPGNDILHAHGKDRVVVEVLSISVGQYRSFVNVKT
jgi:hypothetical protein